MNTEADYKIGEKSIDRNLRKRVTPLSMVEWETPQLQEAAKRLNRKNDLAAVDKFVKGVFGPKWSAVRFNRELHKGNGGLDRRGRARVGYKFTVGRDEWLRYRETLYKRIGYAKSGWAKSAQDLGRNLNTGRQTYKAPPWVLRHVSSTSPGRGVANTKIQNPYVTVENWSKSIADYAGTMNRALRFRAESMFKDVEQQIAKAAQQAGLSTRSMFSNYRSIGGGQWELTN